MSASAGDTAITGWSDRSSHFLHEQGGRLIVESRPGRAIDRTRGKAYRVLSIERDWYRIVDDSGEDYLYPPSLFEAVPE